MKLATTFAAALIATSGFAQAQTMGEGYDMLSSALTNDFEVLGISTDELEMQNLTLLQVAEIRAVLEDEEQGTSAKRNRIEEIIAGN